MGGRGKWEMCIQEGTCWNEQWVLYGNQFDNKFYIKNKTKQQKGMPDWTSYQQHIYWKKGDSSDKISDPGPKQERNVG